MPGPIQKTFVVVGDTLTLVEYGEAGAFGIQVTGAGTYTLQFEASVDEVNFFALPAFDIGALVFSSSSTAPANYLLNPAGFAVFRVRASALTSGTPVVTIRSNPSIANFLRIGSLPALGAGTATIGTVLPRDSDLAVTATGTIGTGVTLTLPAAGVGLFHHIGLLELYMFAGALLVAAATPVLVTSTNLPGSPVWDFEANAAAQGTDEPRVYAFPNPLKSSVANTATTIVAPATTSIIWRLTAVYYAG